MRFPIGSQFQPTTFSHWFWYVKLQRYWGHDLDLFLIFCESIKWPTWGNEDGGVHWQSVHRCGNKDLVTTADILAALIQHARSQMEVDLMHCKVIYLRRRQRRRSNTSVDARLRPCSSLSLTYIDDWMKVVSLKSNACTRSLHCINAI